MEVGLVRQIDIEREMQDAYLSYAMSVIVARALPDARDGLKPVHRRILYAMHEMHLRPDTPYKKSARVVGEVLGKFHPHGDQSVYDALARMAQDFSMRHLLVDGQGNFGSVDGDPPAAMRYTEVRLQAMAMELLTDLDKETVDFSPNFDDSLSEPVVLPAAFPNLLVNGANGIAVGMSTSIPPHNLNEVCNALAYMLERWEQYDEIGTPELMKFVQGPDFPTGGVVVVHAGDEGSLEAAYATGRGRVTIQARAHIEDMGRGRSRIVVTEIPYQVNRSSLISRIAELTRDDRLEGISDLRDESDRQGNRIVIELNRGAEAEELLKKLYKLTPLQTTYSMILLALVDGEPRMLSLKQALRIFLNHRLEVVRRRSEYDLQRARERAHILEGYLKALDVLDEVIATIRNSPDSETARNRLMKKFKFTHIQATEILNLQLRRLARLERQKIKDEYDEKMKLIAYLESLLASPKQMRDVIGEELKTLKQTYGDARRTVIVTGNKNQVLRASDLTPDEDTLVTVTMSGKVSRMAGGRMRLGNEAPVAMVRTTTRQTLYLLNAQGEGAAIPVHMIPEATDIGEGVGWETLCPMPKTATVVAAVAVPQDVRELHPEDPNQHYLFMATTGAMMKKTALYELPGLSTQLFTAIKINNGDRLLTARITTGNDEILLVTAQGMGIRFNEGEVRPMGLVAAGVGGIKLEGQDTLVGMDVARPNGELLLVAADGDAKRTPVQEYPLQGRNGKGVIAWKMAAKHPQHLVGAVVTDDKERVVLWTAKKKARAVNVADAPKASRAGKSASVYIPIDGAGWAGLTARVEFSR